MNNKVARNFRNGLEDVTNLGIFTGIQAFTSRDEENKECDNNSSKPSNSERATVISKGDHGYKLCRWLTL